MIGRIIRPGGRIIRPPSKISQKLAVTHKFDRSGKKYHTTRFMMAKNNKERAKHQEKCIGKFTP
jgi:hypothetical protein